MRLRWIMAAAAAAIVMTAPARAQQLVTDHLKCYKIKDPVKLAAVADLASPQFGLEPGCLVKPAKMFCVPAEKTVVSAVDKKTKQPITPLPVSGPDPGDRVCYKVKCPKPFPPDTEATDQFGTRTLTKLKPFMLCTPAFKGSARFVDNGDGTVTDNYTGLQWEQKTDDGSIHHRDNTYTWSTGSPYNPDGTAFTDFLGQLNNCVGDGSDPPTGVTGGFAGHCDWRLPTIVELQTIVDTSQGFCGGGSGACIDPAFGATPADFFWSGTFDAGTPNQAWAGDFGLFFAEPSSLATEASLLARAVRRGL